MPWNVVKGLWVVLPVLLAVTARGQAQGDGNGVSGAWLWIILLIAAVTAAIWWMSRTAKPGGGGAHG